MKNRLVIFIIVLLFGLSACGTAKTALSQDAQAEVKLQKKDSTTMHQNIMSIVRATIDEIINREIIRDMTIERKVWSPPDTAGTQYIVQEETVRSVTVAQESSRKAEIQEQETAEKTDSTSVSASVEDLVWDTQIDLYHSNELPWWQKTLMVIGAAFMIFLIIRIVLKLI